MNSFGWIDWGIIGVYLVGTMVAGLAMRRYVGKVEHFIVAGREMDVHLGIASLAATEFGIITAMYTAELGFKDGVGGRLLPSRPLNSSASQPCTRPNSALRTGSRVPFPEFSRLLRWPWSA